jgi:uncharacterized protein (DUF488 family)
VIIAPVYGKLILSADKRTVIRNPINWSKGAVVMILYDIRYAQKPAKRFFEEIKEHKMEIVIDIRLGNTSQLAGFTKKDDLAYFLEEICGCDYEHRPDLAPTKEMIDGYKSKSVTREEFECRYCEIVRDRGAVSGFADKYGEYGRVGLLCSGAGINSCHQKLLSDMLAEQIPSLTVVNV